LRRAPHLAAALARAAASAQPLSACLELTYRCSCSCGFCFNPPRRDTSELSGDEWIGVLDELRSLGTLWVALTGGDPLEHPDCLRVARAVRIRAMGLRIFTNGTLVSERMASVLAGLRPISVELSLHGPDATSHDAASGRSGSFAALWCAVMRLRRAGARVVLKTLVTRRNEEHLEAIVALTEAHEVELRLDVRLTPRDDGDMSPLLWSATPSGSDRALALLHSAGHLPRARRSKGETNCGLGASTLAVDPAGNVFPCIQWRHESLGNVRQTPLRQLWRESPVRRRAADVAVTANDALLAAGEPLSSHPYCPALAAQESGDPLRPSATHVDLARAAESVRMRPPL
jgi:MoaA/NifB/PqqE/SkfB family radical SAM enzyme